jgi:hypothetical protein
MRRTKPDQLAISDRSLRKQGFPIDKLDVGNRRLAVSLCFSFFLLLAALPGGCSNESSVRRQDVFSQEELSSPYDHIAVQESLTIDALPKLQRFESERGPLLGGIEAFSQGEHIAVSLGQSKDGRKTWFNMVTFDEYKLDVIRKYFFCVDEDAARFPARVRRGFRFECEMVLDEQVLTQTYPSENAKRLTVLRHIRENLRKDIEELGAGGSPEQHNKMLSVCGMLLSQTLEKILLKLESSPVLASKLGESAGVDFEHVNFGDGKVLMVFLEDMVALRIRFGAFADAKTRRQ